MLDQGLLEVSSFNGPVRELTLGTGMRVRATFAASWVRRFIVCSETGFSEGIALYTSYKLETEGLYLAELVSTQAVSYGVVKEGV